VKLSFFAAFALFAATAAAADLRTACSQITNGMAIDRAVAIVGRKPSADKPAGYLNDTRWVTWTSGGVFQATKLVLLVWDQTVVTNYIVTDKARHGQDDEMILHAKEALAAQAVKKSGTVIMPKPTPAEIQAELPPALETYLKDAPSARIGKISVICPVFNLNTPKGASGWWAQVEINSRNSYGGYTGFQTTDIVVAPGIVLIYPGVPVGWVPLPLLP